MYIALIFEQEQDSVGKMVILDMSKERSVLPVYRINMMDVGVREWGTMSVPTMVVISTEGEVVQRLDGWGRPQDRDKFRKILKSFAAGHGGSTSVAVPTASTLSSTPYTVPISTLSRPDLVTFSTLISPSLTFHPRFTNLIWKKQSSTPSLKRSPLSQYLTRGSSRLSTNSSRLSSVFSLISDPR